MKQSPESPTPAPESPKPKVPENVWAKHCDVEYINRIEGGIMFLPLVDDIPTDDGEHPTLQEAIDANLEAGRYDIVAWLSKHL